MGAQLLSSRDIIGMYYLALEQSAKNSWVDKVSNLFSSDQASETYNFLGQSPAMREWVGGRQAKGFIDNGITIENKHYEATIEFLLKDLRRDKTPQTQARISELAMREVTHWASLLSTLISNGTSTACYDNAYFFDTDHSEGDSGTQSNDITVDISALPVATSGTVTNPSVAEAQFSIAQGVQQIMSFVDDHAEPINETASGFLVMVPVSLYNNFLQAVATPVQVAETQSALTALQRDFIIEVAVNPRLSWTDSFAVFRTDAPIKPLIRQEETAGQFKALAEGSDYEFDNDAHMYGIDAWRNVGYGFWQRACYITMV